MNAGTAFSAMRVSASLTAVFCPRLKETRDMAASGNPVGVWERFRPLLPAVLLMLMAGLVGAASAQSTTVGSISGTIKDSQGAVVPGAEITITEESTAQTRTVKTDEDGFYSAQSLPVGTYSVSASHRGSKR